MSPSNDQVNYVAVIMRKEQNWRQHLLERTNEDFPVDHWSNESAPQKIRHQGWLAALSDAESKIAVSISRKLASRKWIYLGVREAVAKQAVFDAVLVAGDQMALGSTCCKNCRYLSDKVAVVGFDGIEDSAF
ncbi:hypothetical protein O9992_05295 [Vibrio lentus]|nr:hypothetical protein [Vibrio lentus]